MERKKIKRIQMNERKREIISQLINEYDIQSAEDIQDAFLEELFKKCFKLK